MGGRRAGDRGPDWTGMAPERPTRGCVLKLLETRSGHWRSECSEAGWVGCAPEHAGHALDHLLRLEQ
eukprot:2023405-Heterocapsa_arctica.AAC.1